MCVSFIFFLFFFFFKQKTAYEMRISDWSSDVCSSDLLEAYPVPRGPDHAPDLSGAAALYQQNCASCHGATGAGDGPVSAGMDPPPIDFTDPERARQRSVFALAQVIEQGLEGTTMVSYAQLPEDQRWALAFSVGQLAFPADGAARGAGGRRRWWGKRGAVR